jgi:formate/nitrite transporter FocA (FNT family)
MVPVLIGNTIGGVSLVAVVNHAQVVAGAMPHRTEYQLQHHKPPK